MKKEILIGFLVGLAANLTGCYLYLLIFSEYSVKTSLEIAIEQGVLGNIIALGALLSLAVFFLFLKKNKLYRARGVVLATLVAAIAIVIHKFF